MSDEILDLMEERRKLKNNEEKYRELQKQIKHKIRLTREDWIKRQCQKIEALEKKT